MLSVPRTASLTVLNGDLTFTCPHLACSLRFRVCVGRQLENERRLSKRKRRARSDGNTNRKRGRTPEHPSCQTHHCVLGAAIRSTFGDGVAAEVKSGSAGGSREWFPSGLPSWAPGR